MDKNKAAALGNQVLENTLKIIMAMPEDEKMVFGTQVLTKKQIIDKFWKDEEFQWQMAENLDKTVKEYLLQTDFGKKKRRKLTRSGNG